MDLQNKQNLFNCPECDNSIATTKEVAIGTIIECTACGTESEFLSVNPPQLAPLEEEK